jgi:hypothetical protein
MSWEYDKYTNNEKTLMEQEFRHLISIIPVWRQKELSAMEKESAERNITALQINFVEHWEIESRYEYKKEGSHNA